jgi:L-threonylcarbamoyladenylate synthase
MTLSGAAPKRRPPTRRVSHTTTVNARSEIRVSPVVGACWRQCRDAPRFFVFRNRFDRQIFCVKEKSAVGAEVLPTDTQALFDAAVSRVAELLRAGEVVALPTETVYGLAANALDAGAVAKIFEIKGRPAHNPIIVHVASARMAARCVTEWPTVADKLAKAFWPGPLTLVLPRSHEIPDVVTAGGSTVGVRWPSHPFIQAVICACDFPLAAPSANLSTEVSPTNAGHVRRSLGAKVRLIVDGGPSQVGIESTVLDLTTKPPRVLRPGMIQRESLLAVLGELGDVERGAPPPELLLSPGQLPKHYAPRARLMILSWRDDDELNCQLSVLGRPLSEIQVIAHTRIPAANQHSRVSVIPREAQAFARALYAELHRCDEEGAGLIVVEALPETAEWQAINDRLRRAAA